METLKDEKGSFLQLAADDVYTYVDLGKGQPGTHILKMMPQLMEKATNHRMIEELHSANLFQYGIGEGEPKYRNALSKLLSEEYGDEVKSSHLFLTAGATSGLWMVMSLLFKPGDFVFVEDPTYCFALNIFNDFGMRVIPVKTNGNGIVLEDLEEKFKLHLEDTFSEGLPLTALVYLVPVYHNPTGTVLDPDCCHKLVTLSRQYNALLFCDDIYNILHYDSSTSVPKRLFAYDCMSDSNYKGNVVSNGEFSKILAPGLCLGWLEAPIWLVEMFKKKGAILSGGGLNTYTAGIVASAIELGLVKQNMTAIKHIYKKSMYEVSDVLRKKLPPGCSLLSPATGGCHLWIQLPTSVDAAELQSFAVKNHRVSFALGNSSSLTGSFKNYMRISVSFYETEMLVSATIHLCLAIKEFLSEV